VVAIGRDDSWIPLFPFVMHFVDRIR
jgi:hypothetical protein